MDEWRAPNDRYLTLNHKPFEAVLETLDLSGLLVLDFGCGTGYLTAPTLARGPERVIAWDLDISGVPEALRNHPKMDLRQKDFTQENYAFLRGVPYAIISNPPYMLFPFIRGLMEAIPPVGALIITSELGTYNYPGFEVMARLWGEDFDPVPRGYHHILLGGFEGRRLGEPQIPPRNRVEGPRLVYGAAEPIEDRYRPATRTRS